MNEGRNQQALPDPEQVARRLLALKAVIVSALTAPPPQFLTALAQSKPEDSQKLTQGDKNRQADLCRRLREGTIWEEVTVSERAFLESDLFAVTDRQRINFSWRAESALVLQWALGLSESLPAYDVQTNPDFLKSIPGKEVTAFIQEAQLRPPEEIAAARELAEFWHWRSRTRQLIEQGGTLNPTRRMVKAGITSYDDVVRQAARGTTAIGPKPSMFDEDFLALGKAYRDLTPQEWSLVRSITMERHFALNWLCGYAPDNQWDETPTDT